MLSSPTKLLESEPESFIGTETSPTGRIAGNILTGKFGEEEMLAAPDIEDLDLQQRMIRRGKRVLVFYLVLVLAICAGTFWLFGVVVSGTRSSMCGSIGQLSPPECTKVSWEFVVGMISLGIVLLFSMGMTCGLLLQMPSSAKQRRRLREQRRHSALHAEQDQLSPAVVVGGRQQEANAVEEP